MLDQPISVQVDRGTLILMNPLSWPFLAFFNLFQNITETLGLGLITFSHSCWYMKLETAIYILIAALANGIVLAWIFPVIAQRRHSYKGNVISKMKQDLLQKRINIPSAIALGLIVGHVILFVLTIFSYGFDIRRFFIFFPDNISWFSISASAAVFLYYWSRRTEIRSIENQKSLFLCAIYGLIVGTLVVLVSCFLIAGGYIVFLLIKMYVIVTWLSLSFIVTVRLYYRQFLTRP